MKIYEYNKGKIAIKTVKDYASNNKKRYKILKDIYNFLLAVSLLSVLLSIVVAMSVISIIFYNGLILLSIFIDAVAVIFSIYLIYFFWSRYKTDLVSRN
jgi:uncharacterized membrane protein